MIFPAVTAAYAAVLSLIYVGLSVWVVVGRATYKVSMGDADNPLMVRRIRAHANFAEYVPLILLVIALLEGAGGPVAVLHVLLFVLVIARLLHPLGLVAPERSRQQGICRGGGTAATWTVLFVAAVLLLVRVL